MKKFFAAAVLSCTALVVCAGKVGVANNITLDGKLDETAWAKAEKYSNFTMLTKRWPKAPKPLADTAFSVLADKENIYIGIKCFEPDMSKLRAKITGRDTNRLWADDCVEIFFAPTAMSDEYYQFAVGAAGATFQMFFGEKGVIRPDEFSPLYEAKTFHGKDFWSVEMRIPLEALYMTRNKFWKKEWLFNVARQRMQPEICRWSSYAVQHVAFNELDRFEKFGNFPVRPLKNDIYIKNIAAELDSENSGKLIMRADLVPPAAGKYTLEITSPALKALHKEVVTLKGYENTITTQPVTFANTGKGKQLFTMVLKNSAGKVAAARNYRAEVNFVPMQIDLAQPGYSNAFFPGQKSDRLQGKVKLLTVPEKVIATVDGKKYTLTGKGSISFDLPLDFAGKSSIPVKFDLVRAGKIVYSDSMDIRKLPKTNVSMSWIENDRLVIDGKNTFVLGWYGGESNWIVSHALKEKYPTQSAKHPVNVTQWVNMQVNRLVPGTEQRESTHDIKPSQKVLDAVKKQIEANRNKNFTLYYLEDEPECRAVSPVYLKYVYEHIKALDPYHPVMIISREPAKYVDCADILNPHPYINPVVSEDGKRLLKNDVDVIRRRCNEISSSGRKNKIIMLTPQAHSYNINNSAADYPNFDENNSSCWSAVCHGAQGITPYIWYAHCGRPSNSYGWDYLFTSLDRLGEIISSPEKPLASSAGNSMVDTRCWGYNGKYLYAAVNVSPQSQKVTLKVDSRLAGKSWYVFRENRRLTLPEKGLTLTMKPYQVLLLTSEKMDQNLPTLDQVRKRVEQDEHLRCNRGNILFGKHRDIEVSSSYCGYMYQSFMEQQDCMFDGIIDSIAWLPHVYKELWYELAFPKFVPKFSKIRVWGDNLEGMKLMIWKFGEWKTPQAKVTKGKYFVEYDYGKVWSTVKVRMEFPMRSYSNNYKNRLELYEFEMLK